MSHHQITVRSALEADLSEVVDLIMAQQTRQRRRDPRLPQGQTRPQWEAALRTCSLQEAFVALDEEGHVRGYARPGIWELQPSSILHAFLTARNGIVRTLTLPDPVAEDAGAVATALLSVLDTFWQQAGTTGDLVRWPSTDGWLEGALIALGLQLDSICAPRSLRPFFAVRPIPDSYQRVRLARPDDEEALVALFHEELLFHERFTPFVRSSPPVIEFVSACLPRLTNVYRERENAGACLWRSSRTNGCLRWLLSTVAVKRTSIYGILFGRQGGARSPFAWYESSIETD